MQMAFAYDKFITDLNSTDFGVWLSVKVFDTY